MLITEQKLTIGSDNNTGLSKVTLKLICLDWIIFFLLENKAFTQELLVLVLNCKCFGHLNGKGHSKPMKKNYLIKANYFLESSVNQLICLRGYDQLNKRVCRRCKTFYFTWYKAKVGLI